jgi:hypothetical protein
MQSVWILNMKKGGSPFDLNGMPPFIEDMKKEVAIKMMVFGDGYLGEPLNDT